MAEGNWWYLRDGKRHGPLPVADLRERLFAGEIGPDTKVWRKGMDDWARLADVAALRDMLEECPPDVPDGEQGGDADPPRADVLGRGDPTPSPAPVPAADKAGPWPRFFARYIDIVVFAMIGGFALAVLSPEILDSPVAALIVLPLALLIEVPVMAMTGGTPGKWIFGITVRRADGGRLGMDDVFGRNLLLWVYGLGLGIPLLSPILMLLSYRDVRRGRRSKWDDGAARDVRQLPIEWPRRVAGIGAFLLALFLVALLGAIK